MALHSQDAASAGQGKPFGYGVEPDTDGAPKTISSCERPHETVESASAPESLHQNGHCSVNSLLISSAREKCPNPTTSSSEGSVSPGHKAPTSEENCISLNSARYDLENNGARPGGASDSEKSGCRKVFCREFTPPKDDAPEPGVESLKLIEPEGEQTSAVSEAKGEQPLQASASALQQQQASSASPSPQDVRDFHLSCICRDFKPPPDNAPSPGKELVPISPPLILGFETQGRFRE